jgi:hypothetical protein
MDWDGIFCNVPPQTPYKGFYFLFFMKYKMATDRTVNKPKGGKQFLVKFFLFGFLSAITVY